MSGITAENPWFAGKYAINLALKFSLENRQNRLLPALFWKKKKNRSY